MKLRIMLIMSLLGMSSALATPAAAAILQSADPDGLPVLTVLTNQFEGVTLSVLEFGEPSDSVVAAFDYNVSTGDRSFGWIGPGSPPSSGGIYNSIYHLQANFDEPTDFVAIDAFATTVVSEPPGPGPLPTLRSSLFAFDSSGNFLEGSSIVFTAEMSNTAETHTLARSNADISYIVVRGSNQNPNFTYDNLRFNVPEPSNLLLLSTGGLVLRRRGRIAS